MATSDRAFNQVRNILGKLDRSIDEARERRLGGSEPTEPAPAAPAESDPRPVRAAPPSTSTIGHSTGPRAGSSPFGRAKPLQRPGGQTGRWSG